MQNENHQTSQELLDTGSEPTLNPEDPKHHGGLPVKVGSYGGQLSMELQLRSSSLTGGPLRPKPILGLFPQFQNARLEHTQSATSRIPKLAP